MRFSRMTKIFLVCTLLALTSSTPLRAQSPGVNKPRLIEFDPPGTVTGNSVYCQPLCGTLAYANNSWGEVTGFFTDANIVPHGFIRYPDGKFTVLDAPGAGLGKDLDEGTVPYSINDAGVVTGQFADSSLVFHGFIRYRDGSFKVFDVPNAAGTVPWDINLEGTTAGIFFDSNGQHGFVRTAHGETTPFDPTGSTYTYVCEETCLNQEGAIAGFFADAMNVYHGFLRHPGGKITSIDVNGATYGTYPASINNEGTITGYYVDATFTCYGFVRNSDGKISTFSLSGGGTGNYNGTVPYSINQRGTVAGDLYDDNSVAHGFSRSPQGRTVRFNAPGAGTGFNQGTRPSTNNSEGAVAGWYIDANNLNHGFVWIPGDDCSDEDDD
jgi:hypothetical protein